MNVVEFQAIMFIGPENISPLTSEESFPKPSLPVANKPILFYSLNWLENGGFTDVTVITSLKLSLKLTQLLKFYEGNIKVDVFNIQSFMGTVDALRQLRDSNKIFVFIRLIVG